ncbi:hypothetical protein D3C72_607300 [compost metagenome]
MMVFFFCQNFQNIKFQIPILGLLFNRKERKVFTQRSQRFNAEDAKSFFFRDVIGIYKRDRKGCQSVSICECDPSFLRMTNCFRIKQKNSQTFIHIKLCELNL